MKNNLDCDAFRLKYVEKEIVIVWVENVGFEKKNWIRPFYWNEKGWEENIAVLS